MRNNRYSQVFLAKDAITPEQIMEALAADDMFFCQPYKCYISRRACVKRMYEKKSWSSSTSDNLPWEHDKHDKCVKCKVGRKHEKEQMEHEEKEKAISEG